MSPRAGEPQGHDIHRHKRLHVRGRRRATSEKRGQGLFHKSQPGENGALHLRRSATGTGAYLSGDPQNGHTGHSTPAGKSEHIKGVAAWRWTRPGLRDASGFTPGESWMASSFGCAPAAIGTACPRNWGDDSTIHRTFQRWVEMGVLQRVWSVLIEECEELGAVEWEWQSADCAVGKARFGGIQ